MPVPARFERATSSGRTDSSTPLSTRFARSNRKLLGAGSQARTDEKPAFRAASVVVPVLAPMSTNVVREISTPAAPRHSSARVRTLSSLLRLRAKRFPCVGSSVARTCSCPSRSETTYGMKSRASSQKRARGLPALRRRQCITRCSSQCAIFLVRRSTPVKAGIVRDPHVGAPWRQPWPEPLGSPGARTSSRCLPAFAPSGRNRLGAVQLLGSVTADEARDASSTCAVSSRPCRATRRSAPACGSCRGRRCRSSSRRPRAH